MGGLRLPFQGIPSSGRMEAKHVRLNVWCLFSLTNHERHVKNNPIVGLTDCLEWLVKHVSDGLCTISY